MLDILYYLSIQEKQQMLEEKDGFILSKIKNST